MKKFLTVIGACIAVPFMLALATPLGEIEAFTLTPYATAQRVAGTKSTSYRSVRCFSLSATPVYVGGAGVDAGAAGYPICTDTAACGESKLTIGGREDCVIDEADSGIALECLAGY